MHRLVATRFTTLLLPNALSHLTVGLPTLRLIGRIVRDNGRAYLPRYAIAFVFMFMFAAATALSASRA